MSEILAVVEFFPTSEGGLKVPMPSPTPSLILVFRGKDEHGSGEVQVGVLLRNTGESEFIPGESAIVELDLWSDVERAYATNEAPFRVWYAGRIVGRGQVLPRRIETSAWLAH